MTICNECRNPIPDEIPHSQFCCYDCFDKWITRLIEHKIGPVVYNPVVMKELLRNKLNESDVK
jgi:hypothetical protein